MTAKTLLPAPAHVHGPTWRKYVEGGWYMPEHSLGWSILAWMCRMDPATGDPLGIRQPGGPDAGKVFWPTLEQARFLVWWYAIDEDGRFIYRSGLLRRLKGWGKDPLAGAMAIAELCGPVVFSHWDALTGKPVGVQRPAAWIQIAAVNQDQTRNTFTLFPALISDPLKAEFGIELNKTIIYTKAGGMIEGVTSSPLALEGKRPTFVIKNETQWWVEANDGHRMAEVIAGNVDKAAYGGCRALAICNGHIPGEDSDAERDYDAYLNVLAGKDVDTGLLYDSIEAPAGTPLSEIPSKIEDPEGHDKGIAQLRAGLMVARGDAKWLDLDTIILSMLDRRRPITESRRKFLNQINAHEDSWIATWEWDRCSIHTKLSAEATADRIEAQEEYAKAEEALTVSIAKGEQEPLNPEDLKAEVYKALGDKVALLPEPTLSKGDRITLGFDGSKSNDHTALVACRVQDGCLFLIKSWDPDKYPNGEVPREQVDEMVHHTFSRYDVVAFRADVKEFESYVDQWGAKYKKQIKVNATPGHPIAYDMRGQQKRFALDCERFLDAVLEQELLHDDNPIMRQHILNARRHPTTFDAISIRKASKDSSRKIDVAVCAVLAYGARQEFLMSKRNRSGKVAVIR